MRILVVNNVYPPVLAGGYEVECASVVERLAGEHDITVLTSVSGRGEAPPDARVLRELPYVPRSKPHAVTAALDAARAMDVARRTVERVRPELIFVWNGAAIPHSALLAIDDLGIPVAYRVCEYWFTRMFRFDQFTRSLLPVRRRGARAALAAAQRAANRHPALRVSLDGRRPAAISWSSERVRALSPIPQTIEPVLEQVVYPATPQSEAMHGLPRNPDDLRTIAFLGRVVPEKGVDVAVRALAELERGHGVEARLVVAGPADAGIAADIERLAAALGVGERVKLTGRLARDEVRALLGRAHALVVPSIWEEPAGLVLIEAALARVPVVASRVGGMPEMLRDDKEALLFAPGNPHECAAALARTLSDAQERDARTERAYERAQAFRFEPYIADTRRFVEEAAGALRAALGSRFTPAGAAAARPAPRA